MPRRKLTEEDRTRLRRLYGRQRLHEAIPFVWDDIGVCDRLVDEDEWEARERKKAEQRLHVETDLSS